MRSLRIAAGATVLAASLLLVVYWAEAEKESRVLCSLARPGTPSAEVDRLFGTAGLLRVTRDTTDSRVAMHVASPLNLRLTGCTLTLRDGVVSDAAMRERFQLGALGLGRLLGPGTAGASSEIAWILVGLLTLLSMGWGFLLLAAEEVRGRWTRAAIALVLTCAGVVLLLAG